MKENASHSDSESAWSNLLQSGHELMYVYFCIPLFGLGLYCEIYHNKNSRASVFKNISQYVKYVDNT